MSDKLFDALEICLQALEKGETIDSALKRFPALADELRPILEASLHARGLAGEPVAEAVHRRGRAKVLQHAAEMREAKRAPRRQRTWIFAFRPVAVTLMLVVFFLSSTGLVRASSTALPGDNLYPVKRTWEDFTLIFASDVKRETLELTYETERVEEINELLAEGRHEVVSFSGYVTSQTNSEWTVAGVPVLITVDTVMPVDAVAMGGAVTVTGTTNDLGFLVAQSIESLPPGAIVPELDADDDNHEDNDSNDNAGDGQNDDDDSNSNDGAQVPPGDDGSDNSSDDDADSSDSDSDQDNTKFDGVLESADGTLWIVNGVRVDVSSARIEGVPAAGATVTVEGYYNADGVFIATKVTFSNRGEGDSRSGSNQNGSDSNDNGDDDNDNNDNDDNDNNDNDDNSGSGGGGGGGGGDDNDNNSND